MILPFSFLSTYSIIRRNSAITIGRADCKLPRMTAMLTSLQSNTGAFPELPGEVTQALPDTRIQAADSAHGAIKRIGHLAVLSQRDAAAVVLSSELVGPGSKSC